MSSRGCVLKKNRNNTVDRYIYKMRAPSTQLIWIGAEIFTVINVKLSGGVANNFKTFIVLSLAKDWINVNDDS